MNFEDFRRLYTESPNAVWELSKTELVEALVEALTPSAPLNEELERWKAASRWGVISPEEFYNIGLNAGKVYPATTGEQVITIGQNSEERREMPLTGKAAVDDWIAEIEAAHEQWEQIAESASPNPSTINIDKSKYDINVLKEDVKRVTDMHLQHPPENNDQTD
jgi:hypothetical protein